MATKASPDADSEKRQRAIAFGAKAYVDAFSEAPPENARILEAWLMELEDTFLSNPIQQALDLAPYAEFVALVQEERKTRTVH